MEQQHTAGAGTAASQGSSFSSNDSIDDLLGPDTSSDSNEGDIGEDNLASEDTSEEQPEVTEEEDVQAEETDQQPQVTDRQQQVAELAKKYGLDPNNPAHRQALKELMAATKRNQDKDAYIQKLKDDGLTDWERSLQQQAQQQTEQPKPDQQQAQQQADRPVPAIRFNDGFDHLTNFKDFYQREVEAWNRAGETKDFSEVNAVQHAAFVRRLAETGPQMLGPMIDQLVQQRLDEFAEKNLGDVVPAVRQTIEQRRVQEAQDFALQQLLGTKDGFADDWKVMTKPTSDQLLEGRFQDTPLNRILGENPWIQKIRETDSDPKTALIKTNLAQLRAARALFRKQQQSGITPEKAKALMQNGAEQAERKLKDRGRQQLNSGANNKRSPGAEDSTEEWLSGSRSASTLGIPSSQLFAKRR